MIKEVTSNLLIAPADVLVNPVNCVGVMGAGLALQFKEVYPDMFRSYQRACREGDLVPGRMHVWQTGEFRPAYVINFPTKKHWRDKSELIWIEQGLLSLTKVLASLPVQSVAIPALGCGLGGLDYEDVRACVYRIFSDSPVEIWLFTPG